MAMTIHTMFNTQQAQRYLGINSKQLASTAQRLSSGLRINSAKDDAAGLAIAMRMLKQSKGLTVAGRNTNDGVSLVQTAEGSLGKMNDSLQRMRTLAVQAANATYSDADRSAMQSEFSKMRSELDRVARTTNFNGQKLLDGSFVGVVFQVGWQAGNNITIGAIGDSKSQNLGGLNYGQRALAVNQSAMNNLSAIGSGTLQLKLNNVHINLGPIAAATTAQERSGQIVQAINAQTAVTGVQAWMHNHQGQAQLVIQAQPGHGGSDVTLSLVGFTLSQTGLGADLQAPQSGGYGSYIGALQSFQISAQSDGVAQAMVPQGSGIDDALAFRAAVKANYDAYFYTAGREIDGYAVQRFDDGQRMRFTDSSRWAQGADAGYWSELKTFFGLDFSSYVDSNNRFLSNSAGAAAVAAIEQGLNASTIVTGPVLPSFENLYTWSYSQDSHTLSYFQTPNPNLETFDGNAYTPQSLVDQVNQAQGLSGANARTAADIWGTNPSWVTLDGNGNATGWVGANPSEQYGNAKAAWQQAQSVAAQGELQVLRGAQDMQQVRGLDGLHISTQAGAWEAMQVIDKALNQINSSRGLMGAVQARFEAAIDVIGIENANTQAAKARIMDADFAKEAAKLGRYSILQQSGIAMLAQANQSSQNVRKLLGI